MNGKECIMAKAVNLIAKTTGGTVAPPAVAGIQICRGPAPTRKLVGRRAHYQSHLAAAKRLAEGEWFEVTAVKTSTLNTLRKLMKESGLKHVDVYKADTGSIIVQARGEEDFLED